MRVLHFSDIHLGEPFRSVPWSDWPTKRVVGGLNLLLGRGRRFAEAPRKVEVLGEFAREHKADLVVFTGDYTALGTRAEFARAREAVAPLMEAEFGYLNVPGNHDLYVSDVVRERRFEASFGDTLGTDLPEFAVEGGLWPFVRLVDDRVAVVGLNSARPNPAPWRSSGRISGRQLESLESILKDQRLSERFVFVITHYAPCLEGGGPDSQQHGLVNADAFLEVCRPLIRGAILCGHVHRRFRAEPAPLRVPVFCAGSATMQGRESAWFYEVGSSLEQVRTVGWTRDRFVLEPGKVD